MLDDFDSIGDFDLIPAKITARTAVSGTNYYDWTQQVYNGSGQFIDAPFPRKGVQNATEINNATVATPAFVWLRYKTTVNGEPHYEFHQAQGTGGTTITVDTVDGSPTYSNINTLRFDEADGFVLSNPAVGVARIDLINSGFNLTVKESDGSPSYSSINTVEVDQSVGLVVTQPSANTAKISLGLHVKAVDGSPDYTPVHTIEVDEADGFVLSNPSSGVVRIDLTPPAFSLTVREVDLVPTVTNVNTIEFDSSDGLVVTNPGAGVARVDLLNIPTSRVAPLKYPPYFRQVGTQRWFFNGIPHESSNVNLVTSINNIIGPNNIYAWPFYEGRGGLAQRIAFWIQTLGFNGARCRAGIYTNKSDTDLYPLDLVADGGEFDVGGGTGSTGLQAGTISAQLTAYTMYWFVLLGNWSGTSPTYKCVDLSQCWHPLGTDSAWAASTTYFGFVASQTYGALPSTYPLGGSLHSSPQPGYVPAVAIAYGA